MIPSLLLTPAGEWSCLDGRGSRDSGLGGDGNPCPGRIRMALLCFARRMPEKARDDARESYDLGAIPFMTKQVAFEDPVETVEAPGM
jgi:hypothetical protein